MKYILSISLLFFFLPSITKGQVVYSFSVQSIDGKTVPLNDHKGKKLLFIIAPLKSDDSTLIKLTTFQQQYKEQVIIIAIPAIEEGFQKSEAVKIKKLYQEKGLQVLLTEGMQVKKQAGASQSPLLQWLTKKEGNKHFDMDVRGVGHKFFVDEGGKLYAVIGPEFSLSSPVVERIMRKPAGK